MTNKLENRRIASPSAALLLGTAIALAASWMVTRVVHAAEPPAIVYGLPHIEAVLTEALTPNVPVGSLRLELDNRSMEIRASAESGSLSVQNVYHNALNGRFAAELVIKTRDRAVRYPVSGRVYGVVQIPVLNRRVAPGDNIIPSDIDWVEVRADQAGSDIAAADKDLVGMTPRRGISAMQPVRLRDVQTPRVVAKNAIVTVVLQTGQLSLTAQARALEEGGVGDPIRIVNTQSNRIVQATVSGPNLVAVAKPGAALN